MLLRKGFRLTQLTARSVSPQRTAPSGTLLDYVNGVALGVWLFPLPATAI